MPSSIESIPTSLFLPIESARTAETTAWAGESPRNLAPPSLHPPTYTLPVSVQRIEFKAIAVAPELDLNRISPHFGMGRKYTWEEPLRLDAARLKGLLRIPEGRELFLFSFGVIVVQDCGPAELSDLQTYLAGLAPDIQKVGSTRWSDDLVVEVDPESATEVGNERVVVPSLEGWVSEMVATVLARSVALERVESALDGAMDRFEERIAELEQGRISQNDRQLAKDAARILRIEHESLSWLGLLDRPETAWNNSQAESFHDELARVFEIPDRYGALRRKSEVLKDIDKTFSDLAHSRRSTRLEWIIIWLIAIELVLALLPLLPVLSRMVRPR